jgi:hypothetical protein
VVTLISDAYTHVYDRIDKVSKGITAAVQSLGFALQVNMTVSVDVSNVKDDPSTIMSEINELKRYMQEHDMQMDDTMQKLIDDMKKEMAHNMTRINDNIVSGNKQTGEKIDDILRLVQQLALQNNRSEIVKDCDTTVQYPVLLYSALCVDKSLPYGLVMELCNGGTFDKRLWKYAVDDRRLRRHLLWCLRVLH